MPDGNAYAFYPAYNLVGRTPPSDKHSNCYLSLSFWIFLMILVVEQPSSKFSTSTSPPLAHTSLLPAISSGL
jgi:hypothetical protein